MGALCPSSVYGHVVAVRNRFGQLRYTFAGNWLVIIMITIASINKIRASFSLLRTLASIEVDINKWISTETQADYTQEKMVCASRLQTRNCS